MVARTIHDLSTRRTKPFVPSTAPRFPKPIQSEIFGHEKAPSLEPWNAAPAVSN
jgi:DNA-binding NtrC family response regulator